MIRDEWRSIRHSKILWISVSVMILIPFLYSIFFLKSVWDPYGDTKNLPVAVVNHDKSVTYQGEKFAVGKQLVTNLKKNNDLDWNFVSAKQAKQGLKDRKYYTVVTIPSNFSANATTVTKANPKKMDLHYETNESLNYIAKVITDTGVAQVNKNIRAEVTKAYALAMFKQVRTAGDGYQEAADGATKLKNGGVTLQDGLKTYTTGVHTLKDGTTELNTSVKQLPAGIAKLANGGSALATGLDQLNGSTGTLASGVSKLATGSQKVTTGLNQLNGKTGELASGVSKLASGSKQVSTGVVKYTDGVYVLTSKTKQYTGYVSQIADGAQKLNSRVQPMSSMGTDLQTQAKTMTNASNIIVSSLQSMEDGSKSLAENMNKLHDKTGNNAASMKQLQDGMAAMQEAIDNMPIQMGQSISALTPVLTDMQKQAQILASSNTDDSSEITQQINQKIDALKESQNLSDAQVSALKTSLSSVKSSSNANNVAAAKELTADMTQLNTTLQGLTGLGSKSTQMGKQFKGLTTGVNDLVDGINKNNGYLAVFSSGVQDLSTSAGALNTQVATPLNQGITTLNSKVPSIQTQLGQLTSGTAELASKSAEISAGSTKLNAGGQELVGKSAELKSGASQVASGNANLNTQVPTLVSGVSQLFNGSQQVSGGLTTLNSSVPTLVSGVQKLDTGAGQLNTGLQTLQGSTGQLTSGVQQLADGATQLDNNSAKLISGNKQIKDGNKTLATSLQSGADTIKATPLKNANASMMAAPTKTSYTDYTHVPNYGHALAPYVLSLALYVGAIVFNFAYPIRRIADDDGTPTSWFMSKVAVGGPVAIAMAVIEATVMLVAGLKPISVSGYYLTAIMIGLASMFLVMFLSMLFDNPGRFIAMVILMLQLGGSGGTFPMEITNKFFNAIHPFLPLTYSIQAFRQSLTGGWGSGIFWSSIAVLTGIAIVSLVLLWAAMVFLKKHDLQVPAEAEIQMKAGK
ncbi:YhgE/Pip domain-containing protein [Lactiplantibacillus herbarum]|uniref:YhgE/Pip domain-containing protein n=1 Tax=Lactiplantibacillus herbarum TaxID=1670446 RepID=UPI00064F5FE7|nr:YhgE/Pip domain-containing protein [Lactiplantibacillus herbarum]